MRSKWMLILPLVAFLSLSVFLFSGLFSEASYTNQSLVARPLPTLQLSDVMDPAKAYTVDDFKGRVTLLNVWGVWCITCDVELPFLTELSQQGVRIVGLYVPLNTDADFGIKPLAQIQQEITAKVARLGNPYEFNMFDAQRDYSLDLGVTGAPETFLIDKQGVIRLHHIGDVNPQNWQAKFAALYQELLAQ